MYKTLKEKIKRHILELASPTRLQRYQSTVQKSDDAGLGVMVGIFSSMIKSQEDLEGFGKIIVV